MISLGCSKNLVDTEYLMGALARAGWEFTPAKEEANLIMVNTCSFLDSAVRESRDAIAEALQWKSKHAGREVVVAGCIVNRFKDKLEQLYSGVDLFLQPGEIPRLSGWLEGVPGRRPGSRAERRSHIPGPDEERVLTEDFWSYLKVTDGCSNRCSYCLIPEIRGPHRSRSLPSIRREARSMIEQGVREIVLVGQDITRWRGSGGRSDLPRLVKSLAGLPGEFRLRMLYLHPVRVDRRLAALLAEGGKVFPYLDMPIQHASTKVLTAMHRPCDRRSLEKTYEMIRRHAPRAALRTTVMVGHPGEGRREFKELLRFLRDFPFENLGCFTFSAEDGAPAARLEKRASSEEARERYGQVMEMQQRISALLWKGRRGCTTEAVVLRPMAGKGKLWLGRTSWQAPEVDGMIVMEGQSAPGRIEKVIISGSGAYDLEGRIVAGKASNVISPLDRRN